MAKEETVEFELTGNFKLSSKTIFSNLIPELSKIANTFAYQVATHHRSILDETLQASDKLYNAWTKNMAKHIEELRKVTDSGTKLSPTDQTSGATKQEKDSENVVVSTLTTLTDIVDGIKSANEVVQFFRGFFGSKSNGGANGSGGSGGARESGREIAATVKNLINGFKGASNEGENKKTSTNSKIRLVRNETTGKVDGSKFTAAMKATNKFAFSIATLASPIGLAVTGVGLLAGGVMTYRAKQEEARQSLIHMGDELKAAYRNYDDVKQQNEYTKKLVEEYGKLKTKISDTTTPTEQLADAKQRINDIESELIGLHPGILSRYDAENGKISEKLGLVKQINDAALEEQRITLERTILDKSGKEDALIEQITRAKAGKDQAYSDRELYSPAYEAYQNVANQYKALIEDNLNPYNEEFETRLSAIIQKANEIGSAFGKSYDYNPSLIFTDTDEIKKKALDALDTIQKFNKEQAAAESSYQELYDAKIKKIELDLGGTIEEQAKKYKDMSDEGKRSFEQALQNVTLLNEQMKLLGSGYLVDVNVAYRNAGMEVPTPKPVENRKYKQMSEFAAGGFSNRPAIFGEAGLEAAIPINNKPRSHAILNKVNQMMGFTVLPQGMSLASAAMASMNMNSSSNAGSSGQPIQLTMNQQPAQIVIQGNADERTVASIQQALQQQKDAMKDEFGRMLESYFYQKARVSMRGV